jgi:hypothetical protein
MGNRRSKTAIIRWFYLAHNTLLGLNELKHSLPIVIVFVDVSRSYWTSTSSWPIKTISPRSQSHKQIWLTGAKFDLTGYLKSTWESYITDGDLPWIWLTAATLHNENTATVSCTCNKLQQIKWKCTIVDITGTTNSLPVHLRMQCIIDYRLELQVVVTS